MKFSTVWYVRLAKPQIDMRICSAYSMSVKLLTEHNLKFLSLKGGFTASSESTLVKMPHCWKSHVAAQVKKELRYEFFCKDMRSSINSYLKKY